MTRRRKKRKKRSTGFNPIPWLTAVLLVIGLSALAGVYWTRSATVKSVTYSGMHFVDREELEQAVTVPTDIHPDSLDFIRLINSVERVPYVKQADVQVEPGGDLNIHVTERRPIALLADGEYKRYVDEDGIKLDIVPGKAVDVPVLYGFDAAASNDTLNSLAWIKTRAFLLTMRSDPVYDATISEVAWTRDEGVVALSHENGVKLVFGKDDFKTRLRNWKAFYGEIIRTKGIERMRSVDLRFKGQIVTREI